MWKQQDPSVARWVISVCVYRKLHYNNSLLTRRPNKSTNRLCRVHECLNVPNIVNGNDSITYYAIKCNRWQTESFDDVVWMIILTWSFSAIVIYYSYLHVCESLQVTTQYNLEAIKYCLPVYLERFTFIQISVISKIVLAPNNITSCSFSDRYQIPLAFILVVQRGIRLPNIARTGVCCEISIEHVLAHTRQHKWRRLLQLTRCVHRTTSSTMTGASVSHKVSMVATRKSLFVNSLCMYYSIERRISCS